MPAVLTRQAASRSPYTGPNWRGVGRVDVDAKLFNVEPGSALLLNFDKRDVTAGGVFLVDLDGTPELVRFRRTPRGLRARIDGQWGFLTGADLGRMSVVGRLVRMQLGVVAQNDTPAITLSKGTR